MNDHAGIAWRGIAWRGIAWRGIGWRGIARAAWHRWARSIKFNQIQRGAADVQSDLDR
jgi:hypothetical protein